MIVHNRQHDPWPVETKVCPVLFFSFSQIKRSKKNESERIQKGTVDANGFFKVK
jgi:hypothetical protein